MAAFKMHILEESDLYYWHVDGVDSTVQKRTVGQGDYAAARCGSVWPESSSRRPSSKWPVSDKQGDNKQSRPRPFIFKKPTNSGTKLKHAATCEQADMDTTLRAFRGCHGDTVASTLMTPKLKKLAEARRWYVKSQGYLNVSRSMRAYGHLKVNKGTLPVTGQSS